MNTFRQDIIEELIFHGSLSFDMLAYHLDYDHADVLGELKKLKSEGLVIETEGDSIEAAERYAANHPQMQPYSAEDYEYGPAGVKWRFCGGPISKALEAA